MLRRASGLVLRARGRGLGERAAARRPASVPPSRRAGGAVRRGRRVGGSGRPASAACGSSNTAGKRRCSGTTGCCGAPSPRRRTVRTGGALPARLAAEELYASDHPTEADHAKVVAAVADVRATCDSRGVAEALSILHHTMLGPRFADDRLAIVDELVATASASGDGVLTLMGLLWRTVDLLLLGRPDADRSLVEVRQRADALRIASIQLIVREIDVMQSSTAPAGSRRPRPSPARPSCSAPRSAIRTCRPGTAVSCSPSGGCSAAGPSCCPSPASLTGRPVLAVTNRTYLGAVAPLAVEAGEHDEARAPPSNSSAPVGSACDRRRARSS